MKALGLKLGLSTLLLLLLLPGVASAKGPGLDYVTLDGPGIGDPIHVEKHYPYLLDDAIFMHVFGSATRRDIRREQPNAGDLGPRFELTYYTAFAEPIKVDFYPYADRGPVAHTDSGQSVPVPVGRTGENAEFPVHPGWYDYRPGMVDLLQEEGLPTADELNQGTPGSVFFLTGVTLVLCLAFVGLRGRRRQSDPLVASQAGV